jgi:tRNA dimethylallyltransferase
VRSFAALRAEQAAYIRLTASHRPPCRYKTLILWLYARPGVLNPRLDERVDKMIDVRLVSRQGQSTPPDAIASPPLQLGLLDELREMREISEAYRASFPDAPEEDLASAALPTSELTAEAKDAPPFRQAIDRMKVATRQYAKSQVKWIAGKLRDAVDERVRSDHEGLFLLDATGERPVVLHG